MSDTRERLGEILRKQKEELAAMQETTARMAETARAYERAIARGELFTRASRPGGSKTWKPAWRGWRTRAAAGRRDG